MAKKDGFTLILPEKEMKRALKKLNVLTTEKTLLAFGEIGERAANDARTNADYKDQTKNLRGSTGYITIDGKKLVKQDYAGSGGGGSEGKAIGLEIAKKANDTKRGEVGLIIDAGMGYAEILESNYGGRNYKVLTVFLPQISEIANTIAKRMK